MKWKIFDGYGSDSRKPIIVDDTPDVDGKFVGQCICYVATTNPDYQRNAKLIAKLPDLVELLRDARDTLCAVGRPYCGELIDRIDKVLDDA